MCLWAKRTKQKWEQCLGGGLLSLSLSLSLSRCSHFLASLWAKFKGLFYSFYHNFILSCRKFFLFHRSFNSSFCLQKAFFRAFCLFEIFKCCVCALLRPFCHFERSENPQRLKENLLFLDTSLTLSMTNSGFCLKIMDIFTQILKQKFKFFTQNSRHFVNSTHFINLSQISSLMQGFFIFLPQVFAQCKLINFNTRRKNGR